MRELKVVDKCSKHGALSTCCVYWTVSDDITDVEQQMFLSVIVSLTTLMLQCLILWSRKTHTLSVFLDLSPATSSGQVHGPTLVQHLTLVSHPGELSSMKWQPA